MEFSAIAFLLLSAYVCEAARPIPSTESSKTINEQFISFESNVKGQSQNVHGVNTGKVNMQYPTQNAKPEVSLGKISQSAQSVGHIAGNNIRESHGGSNFPALPSTDQGQTNVKQLVQMYNNRDEEAKRTQVPRGNKNKPLSYSSVLTGGHKQTNEQSNPSILKPPPISSSPPTVLTPSPPLPVVPIRSSSREVTNDDLKQVSEALLRKDSNNAAKLISVNYQARTTSSSQADQAPLPLLQIPSTVWNIPTIRAMQALLDNYEKDVLVNEHVTPIERNEENVFLDAIMDTAVIRHLMNFLKEKGIVTPDPRQQREYLKQIWFNMYSRGHGKIGSSGFEHIFLLEIKNNQISGLHNWLYFGLEETAHRANYLGYLKKVDFGDKGSILKFHFKYDNIDKPVDSMFVGTSPELELALYTLCFAFRADTDCSLTLSGKQFTIRVYTFRYRSKNMIGSAYPEI